MTVFEFPVRRAAFGLLAAALFTGPDGVLAQDKPEDGGEAVAVVAVPTEVRAAASPPVFRSPDNALHAFLPLPGDMRVDGILDEEAWASARVFTGFVQETPVEGAPVEHDTEVRVIFGDGAIWVAARMWDSEPHRIVSRMDRRDDRGNSDSFSMHLDPNLDGLTGYMFGVSAANVQRDTYMFNDDQLDNAWNAVWASAVQIDEHGWTAELRIPLSQIRYDASDDLQTWGVNFFRDRPVTAERSYYSLVSQLRPGRVSQMGRMDGVRVTQASRRAEVRPYVVSSLHRGPAVPGNPFFDGTHAATRVGADLRYGLGAAFTLDATINPDFGQVEADPAVINLTAFETFFDEQRPFFVEDARIFDFGLSGGRNQLFYSRRVGRSPSGGAPGSPLFSDIPANTSILGAAKLTGRTASGLSVGVLGAVTGNENGQALYEGDGVTDFLVEPRAEYGVLSLAQDLNGGMTQVRGMVTGMRRALPGDGSFDWLPSSAFNGGVRFEHQWSDRAWALWGFFAGSHVRGDEEAITRIQRASNHYYQRPDATRFDLDPTRTSLTGAEWRMQLERRAGDWTGAVWAAEVSNGFEINDAGFSGSAERVDGGFRVGYREIQPGRVFRSYNVNFNTFHNWSHEAFDDTWSISSWHRARTSGSYNLNSNWQLLNYWDIRANASYNPQQMSRSRTRGGPMMVVPASTNFNFGVDSDNRARVSFGANLNVGADRMGDGSNYSVRGNVRIRPTDNLSLSLNPRFESSRSSDQYVTTARIGDFEPTYGDRYLFADLEQRSFSMEWRADWSFTPALSLQVFAQPLLSSGDYVRYKQLARAESFDFLAFEPGTGQAIGGEVLCLPGRTCELDGTQHVDFTGDGVADYSFTDRDFNFRSLIGNAVLRWEYRPGSTVFFVWQRQQSERVAFGDFDLGRDADALFSLRADNRFIVKMNYWLGL